ncbi:MAG: hypothetical protein IMY72_12950 [Bacteroidetes bacterium]|nr:hypothetical protein [Bacteroidota bacterium]
MIYIILKYSSILIIIATIVIIGTQIYNARLWVDCYPKNIRKAIPKKTKKESQLKFLLGSPFMIAIIFMPILAAIETYKLPQNNVLDIFLVVFGVEFLFNLYDLLVLDWLIFCFITPKYQILKGSEHLLHEYKNYKFHFIGFLKGIILGLIFSGIVTLIMYLINY